MDLAGTGLTVRVLAVNAGSSSVKVRLLGDDDRVERELDLPAGVDGFDVDRLAAALQGWPAPDVVGHRVVHGGTVFDGPVVVDAEVRRRLADLTDLAPLHQPKSLAALDAVSRILPDVPATASFDTAFHAGLPAAASTYAIPREWRERWQIRRYGFHGLSHGYASRRGAEIIGKLLPTLRIVTCHLGAGASLAAVCNGRSVDTTMGFTPLEGLVMATRSGTVDPGLVLWLEEHEHLAPHEVASALEQDSGLLALAGTSDMRAVTTAAAHGEADAVLGLAVYVHRLVGSVAAMAAAAGGLDLLVFTGGVGENSDPVRRAACDGLAFLGVRIGQVEPATAPADREITAFGATVATVVVAAREDLQIAREARSLLNATTIVADGSRAAPGGSL